MSGGFLRGLAFLALLGLVTLTACQASLTGGAADGTAVERPAPSAGLRT